MLTLKTVTLVALAAAPRAQTLVAMNIDCMKLYSDKIIFVFDSMLKTSRPGRSFQLELWHFEEEELCVMHTVLFYLYPRHLCRGVYSFRLDVCPFVRSYVRSFVRSCVRSFVTFRHVRRIYLKVFG